MTSITAAQHMYVLNSAGSSGRTEAVTQRVAASDYTLDGRVDVPTLFSIP